MKNLHPGIQLYPDDRAEPLRMSRYFHINQVFITNLCIAAYSASRTIRL